MSVSISKEPTVNVGRVSYQGGFHETGSSS